MFDIPALIEIALHETLHGWDRGSAGRTKEQLFVDRDEVMIGIRVELALEFGERRDLGRFVGGIRVRLLSGKPINSWIFRFQRSKHVIKGPIFHHENYDVLQLVQSSGHGFSLLELVKMNCSAFHSLSFLRMWIGIEDRLCLGI